MLLFELDPYTGNSNSDGTHKKKELGGEGGNLDENGKPNRDVATWNNIPRGRVHNGEQHHGMGHNVDKTVRED